MNCGNCQHEIDEAEGLGSKRSHFEHCAWWITVDIKERARAQYRSAGPAAPARIQARRGKRPAAPARAA